MGNKNLGTTKEERKVFLSYGPFYKYVTIQGTIHLQIKFMVSYSQKMYLKVDVEFNKIQNHFAGNNLERYTIFNTKYLFKYLSTV